MKLARLFLIPCALLAFAATAPGQTIVNPSFEADPVPAAPGYGPITGWTGGSGINNAAGPFADNGVIPDGQKVAFIQGAQTMRQTVTGFTVGLQYRLRYYENRRSATAAANLQVSVGGATVVPTHEVLAVGGSNPYVQKTSMPFTATATDLEIAFVTSGSGDFTVLLDQVEIGRNLVVLNNNDTGPGSLRQAVIDAPGGSTITFDPVVTGVINQFAGQMTIGKNLTIEGPGAGVLRIRALSSASTSHVFNINQFAKVTISGLWMSDAQSAGIFNAGNLTLTNSLVSLNSPGIANGGTMVISNSTVSGNHAGRGGGVSNSGTMSIVNSTITENSSEDLAGGSSGGGAGIANSGTLTVTNSTIYNNYGIDASVEGGGLYNTGTATLTNSTVSGNQLSIKFEISGPVSGGAGIGNDSGTVTLINCTVANNFIDSANLNNGRGRGAGIHQRGGTVVVRNSIIAGNTTNSSNTTGLDFYGTMTSEGYNLLGRNDNTIITGVTTGNQVGTPANPVNAQLAALASNGGPTLTHALLSNSPAINAGNPANSPATDQRGYARNGTPDKGAFEFNGIVPTASASPNPATTNEDTAIQITLTGTDAGDNNLSFSITDAPDHGTLGPVSAPNCSAVNTCTASVTYTPHSHYNSTDSFRFRVSNGPSTSEEVTVNINVINTTDETGYVVNTTASLGTGGCDATECTLREAIEAANADPGAETISFNIPAAGCDAGGVCTIALTLRCPASPVRSRWTATRSRGLR